jgi:hypothetical protein
MQVLFDTLCVLISLAFLAVLGVITAVAIPGLFMAAAAPWLDMLLPTRDRKPR